MIQARFKKGTIFIFDWMDFGEQEGFWDASPRYKQMLDSGEKFIITDCWIDDETGQPRFCFREVNKPPQDIARDWEIGGCLAYFGTIIDMPIEDQEPISTGSDG